MFSSFRGDQTRRGNSSGYNVVDLINEIKGTDGSEEGMEDDGLRERVLGIMDLTDKDAMVDAALNIVTDIKNNYTETAYTDALILMLKEIAK